MFVYHTQLCFVVIICTIAIIHSTAIEKDLRVVDYLPPGIVSEVSSITYVHPWNITVFVRQHIRIDDKIRHIYISPLALLDVNQTIITSNPITNRTTMTIPLILYTDEQMTFVRQSNANECEQTTECLFHEVSTKTMGVVYKSTDDQTNSYHQYINSLWLSSDPLLNECLLYVNIDCLSNEACLKLDQVLHRSTRATGLHLEYAIEEAEEQQMIISDKHRLRVQKSSELVLERDVDQFVQEILDVAEIRNNDEYDLSQIDLFRLKETLRTQLLGKTLVLTAENSENKWNSVYWNKNDLIRPDHVLRLMKKKKSFGCLSKKTTNEINPNDEMDNYVRRTYDQQSFNLYLKYRHLFQLEHNNTTLKKSTSVSLTLKPILAYELKTFHRSRFLVHQPVHMIKHEDICSISILLSQQVTNEIVKNSSVPEESQRLIDKLVKELADAKANDQQLPERYSYTSGFIFQSTIIETTEPTNTISDLSVYEQSTEEQLTSTSTTTELTDTQISSSSPISNSTKWKQNGVTVAGGNGQGHQLNQLFLSEDIYVDDDQSIYLADWGNHRIVQWKSGAKIGEVVAGGNGQGNRTDQLNGPTDVIMDKSTDSLIICDRGNRRVIRWSRRNSISGQTIISDIDCARLTMDNNGDLYVADQEKVRRWQTGDERITIVAGGNGRGNQLNQLSWPTSLFVDEDHSVYVSDWGNHRVMKWLKGAKEGIVVAGEQGPGNSSTQLYGPQGMFVDHLENVYVADSDNDRIMLWSKGSKEGRVIAGGNGRGQQANQFRYPKGLSFDRQGHLYVVDQENYRVQRFDINSN